MTRHRAASEPPDRPSPADRLRSIQLRSDPVGWVPDPDPDATAADPGRVDMAPVDTAAVDTAPAEMAPAAAGPRPLRAPPTVGDLARGWVSDRVPAWAQGGVERAGVGSVLAGLGLVIALVIGATALLHRHSTSAGPPSYDASLSGASTSTAPSFPDPVTSTAATAGSDPTSIVVDVAGRVRKPGLVTLPAGARVADALAAAGGPLRHREITRVDLAARVADGQLLLIGVKSASTDSVTAGADPSTSSSTAPVALNSASLEELETLPGIGPVTGQKIIDWRTAHGGFASVEQLQQVSGIGPATYAELAPLVTV